MLQRALGWRPVGRQRVQVPQWPRVFRTTEFHERASSDVAGGRNGWVDAPDVVSQGLAECATAIRHRAERESTKEAMLSSGAARHDPPSGWLHRIMPGAASSGCVNFRDDLLGWPLIKEACVVHQGRALAGLEAELTT